MRIVTSVPVPARAGLVCVAASQHRAEALLATLYLVEVDEFRSHLLWRGAP
jgi:hypothetical protein